VAELRIPTRLAPTVALSTAEQALRECSVRDVARDEGRQAVTGRIGVSLLSWGEAIEVAVETSRTGAEFVIRSRSSGPQIIDWGKNESNVQRIKQRLERG
jgi:hypothetical protein